ncbi:MAG: ATP-binding protein [Pseudomonadota bacterium]
MENKKLSQEILEMNLASKLPWYLFIRVAIITILLGTVVTIEIYFKRIFISSGLLIFYILIGITYFFSIIFAFLEKKNLAKNLILFSNVQILWDIIFSTALIYATGGIESPFPFMYFLTIINASILLSKSGAYKAASVISIFYGALIDLQYFGYISSSHVFTDSLVIFSSYDLLNKLSLNILTFFIIAYLSGYLSEQLKVVHSDLIKKNADLRKLRILNQNIVESIDNGLATLDVENRITFINNAFEQITDYSFEEVNGCKINDLFDGILDSQEENNSSKYPWAFEGQFKTKEEKQKYLGYSISNLYGLDTTIEGKILNIHDLTEYKELEEKIKRQNRLAAVGKLAAGIAHEFRNPLTSMRGSIELLQSTMEKDEKNEKLMNIVIRETDRLNLLITNFLFYVKPGQTKFEKILLKDLLIEELKIIAEKLGIPENIEEIYEFNDAYIYADKEQMKKVFWNIIKNALESMPYGGKLIISTSSDNDEDEKLLTIKIADTGVGIPATEMEKIYDPFFTTKPGGTGLGLAIVHNILEIHKSNIAFSSSRGLGTTVTITMPTYENKEPIDV